MKRISAVLVLFASLLFAAGSAGAQTDSRDATLEKVRTLLASAGSRSDINVSFKQSTKNTYNFAGSMTGLSNAQSLEIVVSVTKSNTIAIRVYPHYKGGYINLDKVKNPDGLMRQLLYYSDQNFLFWGADDTKDVFSGYTITLESGFPSEAMLIVLRSIRNTDKFVGAMKPLIDGSPAS